MEHALIIGATGGIGHAVTSHLREAGTRVTTLSRSDDGLDITDEDSVRRTLAALDGPFDLVFVTTGALVVNGAEPEKALDQVTPDAMRDQFMVNCIGPSMILKHAQHLLPRDRRAIFAALSARVGSIGDNGIGGWYSYRTAKAALNQMIHTAAIELGRSHKQSICVALHPGTVATDLTSKYLGRHPAVEPPEAAANLIDVLEGLTPDDTGQFFDWAGKKVTW